MKTVLVAINAKYIHSNPAVYSLKAYAGDGDIEICEYTINNLIDDIIDGIYDKKPDFIGFSTYIWNVEYVLKCACELKKLLPHSEIWLGGPEASYNAEELMKKHPYIDGIMRGEGEKTFKLLIETLKDNDRKFSDIPGITYRNPEITETPAALPMNMSEIPFLYEDIMGNDADSTIDCDNAFTNRIIYYESSRGCPFSCSYCLSSVEKSVRFRDIELVLKELKIFLDKKVKQVKFVDRTFNCKKSHTMEILKFIGENDNGITNFHFEVAADLLDEEELSLIKTFRPGLIQLEIGVQSTNHQTITEIKRKMDLDKVKAVMKSLNAGKNVLAHLDIIAGLPYEDLESFKNSFNEVYRMEPAELQLGFLKVLYGSYMKEMADTYGIVYKDYPPYEVLYTNWLSYGDICELKEVEEMVEVYYNSMQYINTMKYMESFFETPYDMYYELAVFYRRFLKEKGVKFSRQDRYNNLYEFFKSKCEDEKKLELFGEILTYDICLREPLKNRPCFAKDLTESKKELYELYRNLEARPEYKGHKLHIEKFDYDMSDVKNKHITPKYILFDYSERNYIDNSAKTIVIKAKGD